MSRRRARRMRPAGLSACALAILLASWGLLADCRAQAQTAVTSAESEWRADLDQWRERRAREIDAPDGWLTLVGLDWLKPGANSFGAAADNQIQIHAQAPDHIGLLTVSNKTVQLLSPSGGFPHDLTIDGQPAREGPLVVEGAKPSIIGWHGLTMVALERGGRYALRTKDADSPTRKGFHGLNWYAADPHLSVEAKWIPFTPPHIEKIPTVIGTTLDLPAPGVAELTMGDRTFRLEPVLEEPTDKTLFFILRDETSRTTTYQAARFFAHWISRSRAGPAGHSDSGLQPAGEPALRLHALCHVPTAAGEEPAAGGD